MLCAHLMEWVLKLIGPGHVCKDCTAVRRAKMVYAILCALRCITWNRTDPPLYPPPSIWPYIHVQRQACHSMPASLSACVPALLYACLCIHAHATYICSCSRTDSVRTLPKSRKLQCQCLQALTALNPAISWWRKCSKKTFMAKQLLGCKGPLNRFDPARTQRVVAT